MAGSVDVSLLKGECRRMAIPFVPVWAVAKEDYLGFSESPGLLLCTHWKNGTVLMQCTFSGKYKNLTDKSPLLETSRKNRRVDYLGCTLSYKSFTVVSNNKVSLLAGKFE